MLGALHTLNHSILYSQKGLTFLSLSPDNERKLHEPCICTHKVKSFDLRIDFWKSQMETWHRLSRRYQSASESQIAHDNGGQHSRGFFLFFVLFCFVLFFGLFWSPVPLSKINQFLTLSHSKNTKSKETYALTTPHGIWFNGLQLWGSAGRQSLWTFQEQWEKCLPQHVLLNSAGLTSQPQTHHGVGRHHKLLHGASRSQTKRVVLNNKT